MDFIYGLAVFLVIFEGITIHCEGAPRQKRDEQLLPDDVIEEIISKTDFKTIHEAIRSYIVPPNGIVMSKMLQDHSILILPWIDKKIKENKLGITIGNYEGLRSFFKNLGAQVKKIAIYLNDDPRTEITQNIIRKYAKNFEEFIIMGLDQDGFWNEISDGQNDFIFPKVKKVQIHGNIHRNNFNLNLIFPKLEYLTLNGNVTDKNCMKNVKGLKELALFTDTIKEDKFDGIFANNMNLTSIILTKPRTTETMHSIAKHLTNLKTLKVQSPGELFLLRANNSPVYILPSVTHLGITFNRMGDIFELRELSFDVPHLKKLNLHGYQVHDRIVNFIKHFKELEILELFVRDYDPVKCIEQLKHIKELTIYFHDSRFESLKYMLNNFESKLQTLNFVNFPESLYQKYEDELKEINIHLEKSGKPTWTLSYEEQIEKGQMCLTFRHE